MTERTFIRKPADPTRADVLRGERSTFEGDVIEPVCRYCEGRLEIVMGDEIHPCWCVRERAEA
jgi:hypothetical protein